MRFARKKQNHSPTDGTRHTSLYISDDLNKIVVPVRQRSANLAHPVSLLLGTLTDDRNHIIGLRGALKTRNQSNVRVRLLKMSRVILNTDDYSDTIDWSGYAGYEAASRHVTFKRVMSAIFIREP